MASDINIAVLVGRLTRESELRYTNAGTAVARFSLAVNRRKRSGDRWEDEVSFIDCVLWGKQAETLNPYLEKGKQICVQGEIRQNRWEQDGQPRSKIEVVVNSLELLGSPSGQDQGYPSGQRAQGYQRPQGPSQPGGRQFQQGYQTQGGYQQPRGFGQGAGPGAAPAAGRPYGAPQPKGEPPLPTQPPQGGQGGPAGASGQGLDESILQDFSGPEDFDDKDIPF